MYCVDGCVVKTYIDLLLWTGLLSDRKQVCISQDDDNYLQDDNPMIDMQSCACTRLPESDHPISSARLANMYFVLLPIANGI